jgi:hypothetical protein
LENCYKQASFFCIRRSFLRLYGSESEVWPFQKNLMTFLRPMEFTASRNSSSEIGHCPPLKTFRVSQISYLPMPNITALKKLYYLSLTNFWKWVSGTIFHPFLHNFFGANFISGEKMPSHRNDRPNVHFWPVPVFSFFLEKHFLLKCCEG